jgi:glycosyltransferase involved in cell wall biosynthesis
VNDWEFRRRRNALIWALTLRKSMSICRNGIYLERLVELSAGAVSNFQKSFDSNPRLVFIGRLASWKGLAKFIEIASMEELSAFDILLVTPSLPVEFIELLETRFGKRASIEIGKSISQIDFFATDLHLVPLNYGKDAVFIESISLTVLEMACMGIRSIISEGGNSTWPELKELGFVIEADWDNPTSTANKILTLKSSIKKHKILEVRNLIDIKNNLSILLR